MKTLITVRLFYTVTGSTEAAKTAIDQKFNSFLPGLQGFLGVDYEAKKYSADVNPDEVSGYSTYETFHVALFLSNNRPQYDLCRSLAQEALTKDTESADPNAYSDGLLWLADSLEELIENDFLTVDEREEANANSQKSELERDSDTLAHSLLMAALGRVNWMEIAEGWLTTAREEANQA